jgi:cell division inhibitor SepF
VDNVGLWKNTLVYLGFVEDDLEEELSAYRDPSNPRIVHPETADPEASAQHRLASVHRLPVREPSPRREVRVIRPTSYDDVQRIGDTLRASLPVIVNLEVTQDDLSKRVIAFACGLVYGLDASLQKLGRGVYLLSPTPLGVSSPRRQHLSEEGLGS